MPLVTFAHGEAEVDRFVRALRDLVDAHPDADDVPHVPRAPEFRGEQAMTPREAFFAKTEDVKPEDAAGRVSAEWITPYPPGIPAVGAGEVYTDTAVDYLQTVVFAGGYLEGATDQTLGKMRVVA
jgi:arginine/lysine/ornithine decarboxylase